MQSQRLKLLQWCFWFFFGNAILFWIAGLNYLPTLTLMKAGQDNQFILNLFTLVSYLGHLGLLAFLPALLISLLILIFPNRPLIFLLAIPIAISAVVLVIVDAVIYRQYQFHFNGVIFDLAINGINRSIWAMSWIEYLILGSIISGAMLLEIFYALGLWRYMVGNKFFQRGIKWIVFVICFSLISSYGMMIYSANSLSNRAFVEIVRVLPFYNEIFNSLLPASKSNLILNKIAENEIHPEKNNVSLAYPISTLKCAKETKPKNIFLIVIDTWRYDMLNAEVTPNLYNFAKKSWVFNNHFSGGNSTSAGIFSLFYGIPATYWPAMKMQHQGPVLIDALIKQNYQMGIFSSATLSFPAFDQTVFAAIKNLRKTSSGETSYERDISVTRDFQNFIAQAVKKPQPIFGFLFYDSAHSYCNFDNVIHPFQPVVENCNHMELTNESDPTPYLNRYKNAVFFIDQQIKEVLKTLQKNHLTENTIILITGDHGEEFNDNHEGYWGHASNYTHYQVQTPLIIYSSQNTPKTFSYRTTHFDIAPTLLRDLLGCQNSPRQYCLGKDLLDKSKRDYLIAGSYTGIGIIAPDRIIDISSEGNFYIEKPDAAPFYDAQLNMTMMNEVFDDLQVFYKKSTEKNPLTQKIDSAHFSDDLL